MESWGRLLLFAGALLVIAGAVIVAAGRIGLPLGRLPGDLAWRGRYGSVFVPLGTSLLLSAVISLLLWLVERLRR